MATETVANTTGAPGIRYVHCVTAGWLLATAIAILLFVLPSLF